MKQQTPLRKAIVEIQAKITASKADEAYYRQSNQFNSVRSERDIQLGLCNSLVAIVNLLPEERRVIEEAYNNGSNDMGSSEFGGCPKHLNGKDFFTSNFEQ